MIWVWVLIILVPVAVSGAVALAAVLADRGRLIREIHRLEAEAAARRSDPRTAAILERATGVDLLDLPPFWRTVVRLIREVRNA